MKQIEGKARRHQRFDRMFFWYVPVMALMATSAIGQTIATCGPSAGYSFFPVGGLVKPADAKWVADEITKGGITLLRDGDEYDIVYTDAVGGRSAKADGFEVIAFESVSGIVVIAASGNATETYHFDLARRHLVWTQNKYNGVMNKVAAFASSCK